MIWTPRTREFLLWVTRVAFVAAANGQAVTLLNAYRERKPFALILFVIASVLAIWGMVRTEEWAERQRAFKP